MPKTYYDSELTGAQIEAALEAIHGVVTPSNNGKVLCIVNGAIAAKSASEWGHGAVLEPLSVTANGDYTPPSGTDGFDSVHVAVPSATLTTKSITQNGTYNASSDNADGYSSVIVNVSGGGSAVVQPLSVTQNGTYNPPSGVDGYAPVTVNVSGGATSDNDLLFHFDGDFRNSGKATAAMSNIAGLSISNEQSKFGGSSLKCGTAQTIDNLFLDYSFGLGTDDFTLDFWFMPTNLSGSSEKTPLSFKYRSIAVYLTETYILIGLAKNNNSWAATPKVETTIANNQWYHFALVRDGSNIYVFLNGSKIATANFGNDAVAPLGQLTLGANSYQSGYGRFSGFIDELRLKIGTAVWTNDFIPPTEPYI